MENSKIRITDNKFSIIELDKSYDDEWIELISSVDTSVIYHHPLWLRALESEYNQKSIVLGGIDSSGKLKGVLPLLTSRGIPFGVGGLASCKRLSSLPRTPLGGPVSTDDTCKSLLIKAAVDKQKTLNEYKIQIKSPADNLDEFSDQLKKIKWRETFTLELPDSPENLRFGNKTKNHRIKSAVNKAQKSGITIRTAETEEDLVNWYKLYLDTMRYIAVPARPYRLFKYLFENLKPKGLMRLLLAEIDSNDRKRLLTGSVFLSFNKTFFYSFNGRKMNEPPLHQNDFVLYTAINQACAEGYKYFDFGEVTSDNEGLARFKSKWGCDTIQLYHYYYPLSDQYKHEDIDSGNDNGKLRKVLWNKLPLTVTRLIGDYIYKYL